MFLHGAPGPGRLRAQRSRNPEHYGVEVNAPTAVSREPTIPRRKGDLALENMLAGFTRSASLRLRKKESSLAIAIASLKSPII